MPSTTSDEELVPAEVRAVIELFATQLAKVAFPDVDAASLRREVDDLRAEAAAVGRARIALAAALAACETRRAGLAHSAARAVAYARIYSEAHPDRQPLAAALAALAKPVPTEDRVTPKRRGRPPRRTGGLFDPAPPSRPPHEEPA